MNNYIDNEIIMQRKISPIVYVYIMIIIVIFLSLIIFFILFHYKTYYRINGIVIEEESNFYIKTYVPLDDLKYITKNDSLFINNEEYKYKIISIDDEYFTDNITTYQVLKIEVEFPKKYKFNNLNLKLKLIKDNKRIIDYILKNRR